MDNDNLQGVLEVATIDEHQDQAGQKKDFKKVPLAYLWLLGLPGAIATAFIGVRRLCYYYEYADMIYADNSSFGFLLVCAASLAMWSIILLVRFDNDRGRKTRRSLYLFVLSLITLVPLVMILIITSRSTDERHPEWPTAWPALVIWGAVTMGLFLIGMVEWPLALKKNGKFAATIAVFLLIVLISLGIVETVHRNRVEYENSRRIAYGATRDYLRTIDCAIMQYKENEGAYPETLEDLVPNYLRELPDTQWFNYYLDTSVEPPRAACSNGITY
jgi:hypothetical protein